MELRLSCINPSKWLWGRWNRNLFYKWVHNEVIIFYLFLIVTIQSDHKFAYVTTAHSTVHKSSEITNLPVYVILAPDTEDGIFGVCRGRQPVTEVILKWDTKLWVRTFSGGRVRVHGLVFHIAAISEVECQGLYGGFDSSDPVKSQMCACHDSLRKSNINFRRIEILPHKSCVKYQIQKFKISKKIQNSKKNSKNSK